MQKLSFCLSKFKYGCYTAFFLLITWFILTKPTLSISYALSGLQLWFNKMIPTLFPFMVLSGIMVRMELTDAFVGALKPFLSPLLRVSHSCIYGMVVGFLCGFPMGAHVTAQLYESKQISKAEASFLLAFCNNIGPAYFLSFVLPTLQLSSPCYFLIGMYGLPFMYGLILRHTFFRNQIPYKKTITSKTSGISFPEALDDSVLSALSGITKLGGYMIFFQLLFVLPLYFFSETLLGEAFCLLLEITGGIGLLKEKAPLLVLTVLPFGGLSCIAQTYSMIKNTNLSLSEYIMHKMILTAITVCYYCLTGGKYFG